MFLMYLLSMGGVYVLAIDRYPIDGKAFFIAVFCLWIAYTHVIRPRLIKTAEGKWHLAQTAAFLLSISSIVVFSVFGMFYGFAYVAAMYLWLTRKLLPALEIPKHRVLGSLFGLEHERRIEP